MASEFQLRLNAIRDEAIMKRNQRKHAWTKARKLMHTVFHDAIEMLQDDYLAGELNGNSSYLQRGNDKLEFRLEGEKIIRTSTREPGPRNYDLDKLDGESIESEVEEFVRAVYS